MAMCFLPWQIAHLESGPSGAGVGLSLGFWDRKIPLHGAQKRAEVSCVCRDYPGGLRAERCRFRGEVVLGPSPIYVLGVCISGGKA